MKDGFGELFNAVKKNVKYCPWISKVDSEKYSKELLEESKEIIKAFQNKDYDNLTEELGDLLWDIITISIMAEEEGKINSKEIIKNVLQKMKERKPFIFEEKKISREEARKIWLEAKAKQKSGNHGK